MTSGRNLTIVLAALAILPVLYVGSYFALVDPVPNWSGVGPSPQYRVGGEVAAVIFSPIHRFDRWLRPSVWMYHEPPRP